MIMEDTGKKIDIEDVLLMESNYKVKIPTKFKKFLLTYNGGAPDPYEFKLSDKKNIVVNYFFGIRGPKDYDIRRELDVLNGRLDSNFIAIAEDPAGNKICVGIKDQYIEQIYFWDHENESLDDNGNPTMTNMYFLANDIDEFINKLY